MYNPISAVLPIALFLAFQTCIAKSIPANVAALKASIIAQGECSKILKTGFYDTDDSPDTWSYCGDHLDEGIIYVSGKGGTLVNFDIDCDGIQNGPGNDGRCGPSTDTQGDTAFEDTLTSYNKGVDNLNAFVHPYVVFGNVGSKPGYTVFDPTKNGVEPLSLMVVVCNDSMYYGIFGDTNGDDNPKAVVGEASISMATLCFGDSMNGNDGHDPADVLVLAFTGTDAVPGADGALWDAQNVTAFIEFEPFDKLGDTLVAKIGGGSGGGGNETATGGGGNETTTAGGDSTTTTANPDPVTQSTDGGGSGSTPSTTLVTSMKPADTSTTASSDSASSTDSSDSCAWAGHCAGTTCSSSNDCSGELTCNDGKCG